MRKIFEAIPAKTIIISLLHINPQLISYFKSITLALGNIPWLAFKACPASGTTLFFMLTHKTY